MSPGLTGHYMSAGRPVDNPVSREICAQLTRSRCGCTWSRCDTTVEQQRDHPTGRRCDVGRAHRRARSRWPAPGPRLRVDHPSRAWPVRHRGRVRASPSRPRVDRRPLASQRRRPPWMEGQTGSDRGLDHRSTHPPRARLPGRRPPPLGGPVCRRAVPRRDQPARTVLDCARALPFDEALAVADSALRSGRVSKTALRAAAAAARGPGSSTVRRVERHADHRAVNPLESVLRALALEAGLDLTPQLVVAEPGFFAVADLGDEQLRLVVEADGFEHHGTRAGLRADCARHTGYALHGWTSLRFSYEDAMYASGWVVWVFRSWRTGEITAPPDHPEAA